MALEFLSLGTLGELSNGAARGIIDNAIRQAVADLDDRAADDEKVRKVQITLILEPLDNGQVAACVEAKAIVPVYRSPATYANCRKQRDKAVIQFQALDREDPDQMTLDDKEKE